MQTLAKSCPRETTTSPTNATRAGVALTPFRRSRRCLLASVIPVRSMKKMKRAAQLSDDTGQLPRARQQQRVRIGTVHGGGGRWTRTSCTTTSWFGLTEPMFGIEQPMADAHSNDTDLFLVLDSRPSSACPGPHIRCAVQITRCARAFSTLCTSGSIHTHPHAARHIN